MIRAANQREWARTIAYRRRKGTPVQLETLAADLLGCSCQVVEFFSGCIGSRARIGGQTVE
ncbi:MAG: hypothetical protein U0935_13065 [Pirellulales bacterium]